MSNNSNIIIINNFIDDKVPDYSLSDLEAMYSKYTTGSDSDQKLSDSYSVEIWGNSVISMYQIMKNKLSDNSNSEDNPISIDIDSSSTDQEINSYKAQVNTEIAIDKDPVRILNRKLEMNDINDDNLYESGVLSEFNKSIDYIPHDYREDIPTIVPFLSYDEYVSYTGDNSMTAVEYATRFDENQLGSFDKLRSLYNENKNFEKFGKIAVISNPYQRILPNEFKKSSNDYDFIFTYYNEDLKKEVQGWISNKYFQGNLSKKIEIYYISYENGFADEKLLHDVKNQLEISYILRQCSIVLIIYLIFAFIYILSWSKDDGFKKEYLLWLWEIFIGKYENVNKNKIPYSIKNFTIAFYDIWIYLKSKIAFKIVILYIVLNPILNLSFLYFGYFDTSKIEDSKIAQNLKTTQKQYINRLEKSDDFLHLFKDDKSYFIIISKNKEIKTSYFGLMIPTYDYALRVSWEYENDKEKLKDIISNLNPMALEEFSFWKIVLYPTYLPIYSYNNENRVHPKLAYFRDIQNMILEDKK